MQEDRRIVSAANVMHGLILPALAAAATYDELWQAMQFADNANFHHDIGTIIAVPADGPPFDLGDEVAFRRMVSGAIGDARLQWRRDVRTSTAQQLDDLLSRALRAQIQRIRDAQAGSQEAQAAIFAARKTFAVTHGSVFGRSPREYMTASEWADYEAAQAAGEYRLHHPDMGPASNSP
jgi:hypothetical protein